MKIVITNVVSVNTGDAAILKGIIKILHKAFGNEFELVVFDSHHKVSGQIYQEFVFRNLVYHDLFNFQAKRHIRMLLKVFYYLRFQIGLWAFENRIDFLCNVMIPSTVMESLKIYNDADLVISTGGTYLVENYSLEPRIFELNIAVRLKKPLLLFTQSVGPFNKIRNRKSFKRIFNYSFLVLLRDKMSRDNLDAIEAKRDNSFVTADAAFALSDLSRIKKAEATNINFNKPSIAISVRYWSYFKNSTTEHGMANYLNAVKATCIHLIRKYGANITFLSTCQGIEEYLADDSKIALKVLNMIPGKYRNSISIDSSHYTPEQLMDELAEYDLVVSTRLHMAILSLNVGVPALPIAYEYKTKELFSRLGQEKYINDIEELSSGKLIRSVDDFIANININKTELFNRVESEAESVFSDSVLIKSKYDGIKSSSL